MRALRRWVRKARCRAKYGKACPHGGHYGGKRRNRSSMTPVHTHLRKAPPPQVPDPTVHREPEHDESEHHEPAHRATKRSTAEASADA